MGGGAFHRPDGERRNQRVEAPMLGPPDKRKGPPQLALRQGPIRFDQQTYPNRDRFPPQALAYVPNWDCPPARRSWRGR